MPTRTEIVISFGEIVECLPPGKSYRRKRYNSFDANIGNEENCDPSSLSEPCDNMKPDSRKGANSGKCDDTDDEISFRDHSANGGEAEEVKTKLKRKSNTEKFLEDNANYFQLEVLNSKTRSHRLTNKNADSEDEASTKEEFQNSFFDFLKSKGVSQESGRSRHKSAESEADREKSSGSRSGRSKSSFSRYGRSRSSGRNTNGRERRERSVSSTRRRRRKRSLTDLDGSEVFISESDSECSVRLPRLDVIKSRVGSASPSESSDISVKSGRNTRSKSSARDLSPTGSDGDITARVRSRRSKSRTRTSRSSVRESTPVELNKQRRRSRRDLSPIGSDAESLASNASKSGKNRQDSDDDDDEKGSKRSRRNQGRRSELDKLLEAVDTSFHFETAAAERKRLSESGNSGLGPLEIDCSDTGSETSFKSASKRKLVNSDKSPSRKKFKVSNNLLKTASPDVHIKSEDEGENSSDCAWEGWDKLNDDLDSVTDSPVQVNKLHFSFESVPLKESWFLTYQRQDRGDEIVFYPTSTSNPFLLPYQMPYSAFLLNKPLKKENDASNETSKASSPVRQLGEPSRRGDRKKISDCESTDSSEDLRRGRTGRSGKLEKLGRAAHLLESNYRVSPRCHASTKSLGIVSNPQGDIEDLEEFHIMQDERELSYPPLPSYLSREENSNDSFSSSTATAISRGAGRSESQADLVSLAKSLDSLLQDPGELGKHDPEAAKAAKLPPTRSRVSSDQLLSPKKAKKKKKGSIDGPGYEPLDQLVADNVDPLLLDCLEDELPTVPGPLLEPVLSSPLQLLETYSLCRSMKECNSRWLRPNNRESLGSARKEARNKKNFDPTKPKRIFIYKDDLPGFSHDADFEDEKLPVSKRGSTKKEIKSKPATATSKNKPTTDPDKPKRVIIYKDDLPGFSLDADLEDEKLPVSKRGNTEGETGKKSKFKNKKKSSVKEASVVSDEDVESVESFSSNSSVTKKRRKTNKTGFPTPKKKKKLADAANPSTSVKETPKKLSEKSTSKSEKSAKISPKKLKNVKQKKMDDYLTKKSSKSNPVASAAAKRSATLKAKNYSEVESDTDSLLETSLITPVPDKKLKPTSVQKNVKKR